MGLLFAVALMGLPLMLAAWDLKQSGHVPALGGKPRREPTDSPPRPAGDETARHDTQARPVTPPAAAPVATQ